MVDAPKYGVTLNCKVEEALAAPAVFAGSVSGEESPHQHHRNRLLCLQLAMTKGRDNMSPIR